MYLLYGVSSIMKEEGSRQIGLQYVRESYIHNIICGQSFVNEEKIKIEGKAHWSKWQCMWRTQWKNKGFVQQSKSLNQKLEANHELAFIICV